MTQNPSRVNNAGAKLITLCAEWNSIQKLLRLLLPLHCAARRRRMRRSYRYQCTKTHWWKIVVTHWARPNLRKKKERIQHQFDRKLIRLGQIEENFNKCFRVSLRGVDEVFLSKIRLPKPLSGYMLFAREKRGEIQSKNTEAGFGEIGRLIGQEWQALSDESRMMWRTNASSLYDNW